MKIIEIDGIKYQLTPIKENKPETLYDIVKEWVDDPICPTVDKLIRKIESWLPKELNEIEGGDRYYKGYNTGYNAYREQLLKKLK
jgi:hypothetical protein